MKTTITFKHNSKTQSGWWNGHWVGSYGCFLLLLVLASYFTINSKWPLSFPSFLLGSVTFVCP